VKEILVPPSIVSEELELKLVVFGWCRRKSSIELGLLVAVQGALMDT
jgi:hypothetical protein